MIRRDLVKELNIAYNLGIYAYMNRHNSLSESVRYIIWGLDPRFSEEDTYIEE
jgi:hypothetical protein